MNLWLTVLTGISDPELVFGFHSSHVVMCVLTHERPNCSTLADEVLKTTPVDFKNVSRYTMCVPNTWRPVVAARHSQRDGLAFRQDFEKVGRTLVDWQRGIVHCVLIQHL